jgi:hypothetical protein
VQIASRAGSESGANHQSGSSARELSKVRHSTRSPAALTPAKAPWFNSRLAKAHGLIGAWQRRMV